MLRRSNTLEVQIKDKKDILLSKINIKLKQVKLKKMKIQKLDCQK